MNENACHSDGGSSEYAPFVRVGMSIVQLAAMILWALARQIPPACEDYPLADLMVTEDAEVELVHLDAIRWREEQSAGIGEFFVASIAAWRDHR